MRPLYEINQQIEDALLQAEQHAAQHEGEITEELDKAIVSLQMEREEKVGHIARYHKSLLAEAEMVKAEEDKLRKRRQSAEKRAQWLKEYLSTCLQPGEKFTDANTKISWRKSIGTEINMDLLPDIYKEIVYKPCTTVIKEALKGGSLIPGAALVTKNNIQIQ